MGETVSGESSRERMMHAVGFHEHGDIEKFQLLEVKRPVPTDDEVLVDVAAAALNHQDLFAVRELDHYVPEYPFWGGGDISGRITELGEDVDGWSIGDPVVVNPAVTCGECEFCIQGEHSMCKHYQVYGEHRKGGFAEYVTVPAENLERVPENYDLVTAAAVPLAAATAWRALSTRGQIKPFEDVLIVGATGGVGTYAIQIAKNVFNVNTLYATTSTEEKAEFLRDIGVDHVINYTEENFDERIWEMTNKRGVDVVYNNVGGNTWVPAMRSLRNGGRLIVSGATAGPNPETEIRLIFVRQLEVIGSTQNSRKDFQEVLEYVWNGTIEPIVQEAYPLEEFDRAFSKMANRELHGKVLLSQE
ncbi:zinc-binding dehydrogenase [Haladaptatus halobius]|uniref:zinc-binding dehydrogenase n=1 Tax=Haladaptatus halobius TaxID=2884875 RepID=UPI001D0AD266|nr:alcohol dehydrogenase catalytic domain-containing protein [Haladaptatus halobius]